MTSKKGRRQGCCGFAKERERESAKLNKGGGKDNLSETTLLFEKLKSLEDRRNIARSRPGCMSEFIASFICQRRDGALHRKTAFEIERPFTLIDVTTTEKCKKENQIRSRYGTVYKKTVPLFSSDIFVTFAYRKYQ